MKKIYDIIKPVLFLSLLIGCDKDFEEVNTNPQLPTSMNPAFLFTDVEVYSPYEGNSFSYGATIVQQHQCPFAGVLAAGNLNRNNDDAGRAAWNQYYGRIKALVDILDKTKDDPERKNLYNMARIWKAFCFQIITDVYGDVPYFQAGRGFLDANYFPAYDTQEEIYLDLLKELDEASKALDPASKIETTDLFYSGNIEKWKKLGNSILLRVAMRLSKVNATKAQEYAVKAVSGGVMQSNEDNCYMRFTTTIGNPVYGYFTGTEQANYYLNQTFIDYLKNTNDPRLSVIAVTYSNPSKNWNDPEQIVDDTVAHQIGMPCGYDDQTLPTAPGYPGKGGSGFLYSQVKRNTVVKQDAPSFLITYAQTQLLLAEARQRNWITAGTAEEYYQNGIRAHMEQFASYDVSSAIPVLDIDGYISTATLTSGQELEQIGTQYWVACFLNGYESWANWRRTGFPVLSPNGYSGKDIAGDFIRRMRYPAAEVNINTDNYETASVRQFGSSANEQMDRRVWWDVE